MKDKNVFYYFALLGQVGLILIINILICVGVYKLAERFTGQNPILFIGLVILGVFSGFYSVYKMLF